MTKLLALIVLLVGVEAWAADTVLCGDDDNSGTQSLLKSVGVVDRDCDGAASVADGGTDCDDTNILIHDGSYTPSGCSAGSYRYCDAGAWKSGPGGSTASSGCTPTTLGERTNNYYFSASGSGTACSFASPCALSALSSGGAVTVVSPAALYLVGTTDVTATAEWTAGVSGSSSSTKNIIARYPTSTAKLNFNCSVGSPCKTINLDTRDNWIVRGFEITGGYGSPVTMSGDNIEVFDNYIHDAKGIASNNVSGVNTGDGVDNLLVHHNIINNIYDPTKTASGDDRQNVNLITFFTGENKIAEYNIGGYTHGVGTSPYEVQGGGGRFKHAKSPGNVTLASSFRKNIFYNVANCGELGGAKQYFIGNLCVAAPRILVHNLSGGDGYFVDDIRIEDNTLISAAHGGSGGGVIHFSSDAFTSQPTIAATIKNNVVDDSAQTTYGSNSPPYSMLTISHSGPDADYAGLITAAKISIASNCYYNSNIAGLTAGFSVYGDNSSTSNGSVVNFASWKSTYNFDTSPLGYNEDPALDTEKRATSIDCDGRGWEAQWPSASVTPTPTPTPTPAPPGLAAIRGRLRR